MVEKRVRETSRASRLCTRYISKERDVCNTRSSFRLILLYWFTPFSTTSPSCSVNPHMWFLKVRVSSLLTFSSGFLLRLLDSNGETISYPFSIRPVHLVTLTPPTRAASPVVVSVTLKLQKVVLGPFRESCP